MIVLCSRGMYFVVIKNFQISIFFPMTSDSEIVLESEDDKKDEGFWFVEPV